MPTELWNIIIIAGALFLLFSYAIQCIFAVSQAYRHQILQFLFTPKNISSVWFWFVASLLVPVFISFASDLFNLQSDLFHSPDIKNQDPEILDTSYNRLIIILVLSFLYIFITLEFSLLVSNNKKLHGWQNFLGAALFLDIFSVVIVSMINRFSLDDVMWAGFIGIFAFASSFVIILFAKFASEDYGTKSENGK